MAPDSRYAKLGSMDNTIQASSGFISVTGFPDAPVKTSATFIDMGTGSHLVSGILAALIHRGKTGRGQHVEVAMLDVAIPALTSAVAPALQGMKFKRLGNRHWGACPTNIYPASDGEILIFCLTEAHWRTLAKLMGHEESNRRPAMQESRRAPAGSPTNSTHSSPNGPAHKRATRWLKPDRGGHTLRAGRTVEEVIADPEIANRRMLIDSDYPTRGKIRVAGTPIKMSAAPEGDRPIRRPPELGEHNAEVTRVDRDRCR